MEKRKIKAACPFLKRQNEYQGECESSGVGYLEKEKKADKKWSEMPMTLLKNDAQFMKDY